MLASDGEPCARFGESDCRFWSLSGITRVVPIADEAAWEHAGKSAAFADKMGLIEIPKFMDNIRPRSVRGDVVSGHGGVEPDRSRKQLWRHSDFRRETALKLARAQIRSPNEVIDPQTTPRGHQQTGCALDRDVGFALLHHHCDPTFDRSDTGRKVRRQAYGVLQGQCRSAENIRRRGGVVDQRRHIDPDQSVQASRVKQDVENMNPARLINPGALIGLRTGYICSR